MNFIQLAFRGKNKFLNYLTTAVLTASTMLGFGLLPYMLALKNAGLPTDGTATVEAAIAALGKNEFLALQLLPFLLAFFVLLVCVKLIHKRPVLSMFTTRFSFSWKRFFLSFSLWGMMLSVLLLWSFYFYGHALIWNFNGQSFWGLLLISIFIIPFQTAFEELFFRGFLFQGLGSFFRKGLPTVLFTGLLFGLMHGANPEVKVLGSGILIYYIVTGFFLGVLTLMDDGLELSMGFHAVNNIFGALILTNNWQVFQSDALFMDTSAPGFGWDSIITMVICYPLLLWIYARIYKWKGWKKKFTSEITRH